MCGFKTHSFLKQQKKRYQSNRHEKSKFSSAIQMWVLENFLTNVNFSVTVIKFKCNISFISSFLNLLPAIHIKIFRKPRLSACAFSHVWYLLQLSNKMAALMLLYWPNNRNFSQSDNLTYPPYWVWAVWIIAIWNFGQSLWKGGSC